MVERIYPLSIDPVDHKVPVNPSELAEMLQFKHWPFPKNITAEYPRVSAIFGRDILDVLLNVFRAKEFNWTDKLGAKEPMQSLLVAVFMLVRDVLVWPWLVVITYGRVPRLRTHISRNNTKEKTCVYLRTDHNFDPTYGGALSHMLGVINGLEALKWRVDCKSTSQIAFFDGSIDVITPDYKTARNIPNFPEIRYSEQLFKAISSSWPETSPRFVYQRYSLGNYTGLLLKEKYGVPYICEFNGPLLWIERQWAGRSKLHEKLLQKIEDMNVLGADLVVVVSHPLEKLLIEKGVPKDRILVNPNGVDTDVFHPNVNCDRIRSIHNLQGKTVIGFIGSFGVWHGAEILADAFGQILEKLNASDNDIRLMMVGDGNTMPEVKRKLRMSGAIDKAVLTGAVPQDQAPEYLAACDILVAPNVPNLDGTPFFGSPTKVFEYMATGRAIVASNLDQIGDVLEHNKTALLVQPGDVNSLTNGILKLINAPETRKKLGVAARKQAILSHCWVRHVEHIINSIGHVSK